MQQQPPKKCEGLPKQAFNNCIGTAGLQVGTRLKVASYIGLRLGSWFYPLQATHIHMCYPFKLPKCFSLGQAFPLSQALIIGSNLCSRNSRCRDNSPPQERPSIGACQLSELVSIPSPWLLTRETALRDCLDSQVSTKGGNIPASSKATGPHFALIPKV